ncbi:CIC11C00000001808 [Sungouiella intermedia]|uniref:Glutamyl-tRNA(Gln) amidotransferase subunit A, mitochondrial n=1 Tax=Sungouiella intermedia TaxID=45354 RepID=A0A1L0DC39_9ASCO|nr:CIC11C00000001808 [[Candida] intermedia]
MLRKTPRLLTQASRDAYNSIIVSRLAVFNSLGALANTAFIVKDNISTTDEPTSCGSPMLKEYVSPFNASVVKLLEDAGLTMAGKSNLDEFGMGSGTTFSVHGPTINPRYSEKRVCGGSSGGSAAAVAAELADFALGTDTGGSVRQPASYCGIVGFKPTYGRISRYGVVAYAQGFDTVGILAREVATAKRVFKVLNKYDEKDITSLPQSIRDQITSNKKDTTSLIIGVPKELLLAEISEDVTVQFEKVLTRLMDLGHTIKPVSIPSIGKLLSAYYTLATAEAASNLSRFDGIVYGSDSDFSSGMDRIAHNRSVGFGAEVQRRIVLGNYTLSSESGDYFLRATRVRRQLVRELNDIFIMANPLTGEAGNPGGCDLLISPTAFGRAPLLEEFESDTQSNFLNGYINDVLTIPGSMAGLPSISVPCEDKDFGVQIMGQFGDDMKVLEAAEIVERK